MNANKSRCYSDVLLASKPSDVVIHVGCNDIWGRNCRNTNSEEIANGIILLAKKCRNHGVQRISISSLFITKVSSSNQQQAEINELLKSLCSSNGFRYIDNSYVTQANLGDEVHLKHSSRINFYNISLQIVLNIDGA